MNDIRRKNTLMVKIGDKIIGGGNPILIQSMTKTDTRDARATVNQIRQLEEAGCEIIRVAVPDIEAAEKISEIKKQINIPLVADIHFNWQLAIEAIKHGADKIRIGYKVICDEIKTREILKAAKDKGIPIRIGVNAGSLDNDVARQFGVGVEAMTESAMRYIKICEDNDFFDIVISMKSSDALETIRAYEALSRRVDYPLHLGVTNAGSEFSGMVASAAALGTLLERGIGDTIRVSLTGSPIEEVKVGWEILKSLGLRQKGVKIISCPTCGRLKIPEADFTNLVKRIENNLSGVQKQYKISVIGCEVNGPGEALKADLGVMIIDSVRAVLFRGGKIIKKIPISEIEQALLNEIKADS